MRAGTELETTGGKEAKEPEQRHRGEKETHHGTIIEQISPQLIRPSPQIPHIIIEYI